MAPRDTRRLPARDASTLVAPGGALTKQPFVSRAGSEPILYMCVAKGPLLDAATLNLRGAKQARPEGGRSFAALQPVGSTLSMGWSPKTLLPAP